MRYLRVVVSNVFLVLAPAYVAPACSPRDAKLERDSELGCPRDGKLTGPLNDQIRLIFNLINGEIPGRSLDAEPQFSLHCVISVGAGRDKGDGIGHDIVTVH